MRKKVSVLLITGIAALLPMNQVIADTITKPHTFANGTAADATQVNENFDTVYDQVNKMGSVVTVDDINASVDVSGNVAIEKDQTSVLFTATNYGNGGYPIFNGKKARGSQAAPSAVIAEDRLAAFGGSGYGATGWAPKPSMRGTMLIKAAETWTDVAQGAHITFETAANGTNVRTERMRITDAGNVGIGTETPTARIEVVQDSTDLYHGISLTSYSRNPIIRVKAAGGSKNAPTATLAGDAILSLVGEGYNENTGWSHPSDAQIRFIATEDFTGTARGTAIQFMNAANQTTGRTERMRIDQNGNVGIGTSTPQATLDINGYMKLAKNFVEPVTCDASQDGSLALTSGYKMCACNGTDWVNTADGLSCSW